ncbi:MAG: alginate export family protein [Novosphingobium sp.]
MPLALGLCWSSAALAQQAAPPVSVYADIRYRLEVVDQADLPDTATASTLRVRAGVKTREWHGLSAVVEGEAIAVLGKASYNDTVNGKTNFPVVADPADVLLNQAYLRWRPDPRFELTAGRQAVNYDNQRWIGSVGWRQNDQTLDAVRVAAKPFKGVAVDYVYAWRVNRVFGPDSPQGIWHDTAIHGLRASYTIKNIGTLSGYGYWLDVPSSPASSSRTLGARITGEHAVGKGYALLYAAEYARQQDFGANPRTFALNYWLVEPGIKAGPVTTRLGFERLEGNGTAALQTPLATLHAFNGWADKFLTTPANGLRDLYVDASFKVPGKGPLAGLTLRGAWHDFNSTRLGIGYGQEWDALVSYPLTKQIGLTAKFARYDAQAFAADTTKAWFQIEAKF